MKAGRTLKLPRQQRFQSVCAAHRPPPPRDVPWPRTQPHESTQTRRPLTAAEHRGERSCAGAPGGSRGGEARGALASASLRGSSPPACAPLSPAPRRAPRVPPRQRRRPGTPRPPAEVPEGWAVGPKDPGGPPDLWEDRKSVRLWGAGGGQRAAVTEHPRHFQCGVGSSLGWDVIGVPQAGTTTIVSQVLSRSEIFLCLPSCPGDFPGPTGSLGPTVTPCILNEANPRTLAFSVGYYYCSDTFSTLPNAPHLWLNMGGKQKSPPREHSGLFPCRTLRTGHVLTCTEGAGVCFIPSCLSDQRTCP